MTFFRYKIRQLLPFLAKLVSEFKEFKPRLKSPENRCQLSVGLNLEKF